MLAALDAVPAAADRFDPYRDRDRGEDLPDAPARRRRNLLRSLAAQIERRPRTLWLAEAPGHDGTRRTGLPLVPETHLAVAAVALGLAEPFTKATRTPARANRTGTTVWRELERADELPLLWNAVPHHPHPADRQHGNRTPTAAEITTFRPALALLLELTAPDGVRCIGRVAERAIAPLRPDAVYVRHPAQGGLTAFRAGIHVRRGPR